MSEYFNKFDSIIAISSGNLSKTAITLIRISGPIEPDKVLECLSISAPIEPKRNYLTNILDQDAILDEIIFCFYKGPASFTGENVYELAVHGNPLNVNRIVKFLIEKLNLRMAGPGEFSYRAFRNKKVSLSEIEGLDLLLSSDSQFAIDQGLNILSGEISSEYKLLKSFFLDLRSSIEILINFSDDVGESESFLNLKGNFEKFFTQVVKLHDRAPIEPDLIIKPKVVLFGKPNSGKSTLFNRLLKKQRALVSDTPGTTRDYISESIVINNVTYELVDTAGIRDTFDEIEKHGIEHSKNQLEKAFFSIHLSKEDVKEDSFDLVLLSHRDNSGPIEPNRTGPIEANLLDPDLNLEDYIFNRISEKFIKLTENNPIIIPRQRDIIKQLFKKSNNFNDLVSMEDDLAIISNEIGSMGALIEELIGQVHPDDVLDNIFSNFCIGK